MTLAIALSAAERKLAQGVAMPCLFYRGHNAQYWLTQANPPLFQARPRQGWLASTEGVGYPDLEALFKLKNEPLR